jgi:hypothetical protein
MPNNSILFFILACCTANVYAHHGVAQHYDDNKPVSLDAVITSMEFVNPHAYVYFDVASNDGKMVPWRCEMAAATALRRRGWGKDTLSAGQNITVKGSLARREENVCVITGFIFEDGLEVGRITDITDYQKTKEKPKTTIALRIEERIKNATGEKPDFSGTWVTLGRTFRPGGGAMGAAMGAAMGPAMGGAMGGGGGRNNATATEAGLAAAVGYDANFDNPNLKCRASDIIMAIVRDAHVNEIIQGEESIQINFGYMDVERTVHMTMATHPDTIVSSLEGHSIGRWEGSTLVVDTIGFLPSTYGGNGTLMTSEQMHITERFEFDAIENQLRRHYTLEDPLYINGTITGTNNLTMTDEAYEKYGCKELSGKNNERS